MYKFFSAILLSITVCLPLSADEISLSSMVSLVLENDPAVQMARSALGSSMHGRNLLLAGTRPQITATEAPAYTFSSSRVTDPLTGEFTDLSSHRVSIGAVVSQVLPTDGALSANISDSVAIVTSGDDVTFAQSPRLSLSVSQPVFTNGKLIDLSIYSSRRAVFGDLPVSRAELREKAARNTGLLQAFSAYKSTFVLRRQLQNQDANQRLAERRLDLSRLRSKQGSIASRDLWEEELAYEGLNEIRLELKYALLESEQNLARRLGIDSGLTEIILSDVIPELRIEDSEAQLADRALTANPDVLDRILARDEASHNGVLNGREYSSNLSMSLLVTPKYAPSRIAGDDFVSSISDFFDDNAYLEPVVSIGLSIPLYDGGQAKSRREIDRNTVSMAETNLAATRHFAVEAMQNLFLRRSMLEEKLELIRSNLSFENERLAEKQRLFNQNQITSLEVDGVRLKATEKELEIWTTEADLFLNAARILDRAGYDLQSLFEGYN